MATRINQSDFVKTALRLPPDVHAMVHEAAAASGRSYNAEIVARLQASFQTNESEQREFEAWREVARLERNSTDKASDLGYVIEEMIAATIERDKVDRATALERLVAKGYASTTNTPVFIYYASPGMTTEEVRAGIIAANVVVPPDAHMFFDRSTSARAAQAKAVQRAKKQC